MSKLCLVCLTVLFCVSVRECNRNFSIQVKNKELDIQLELAKAIGKYSKPSLEVNPDSRDRKPEDRL